MKALLLENISRVASQRFASAGWDVETMPGALGESELIPKIRQVSVLGIRSKTKISQAVLDAAPQLMAIGAYCIGVDAIDRTACNERGVGIFNDPHSNSRSVAELALGEIIMLVRRSFAVSIDLHAGNWNKSAKGCHEVRGLTLGIVGYGKIGSQLSDLAEAMGMRVIFNDVADVLARGLAKAYDFRELLREADVVTLHVDGKPRNRNLFGEEEFELMKDGAYFLNSSRGFVVDHGALAQALYRGKIQGAAIDVFPHEPEKGGPFSSPLQGLPNVILTPHIGGSTEEAQESIGNFVSARLLDYLQNGSSTMSVNLPHCDLELEPGSHRLMHLHSNVPGILLAINKVLAARDINIERQVLDTRGTLGYAIYDINKPCSDDLLRDLRAVPHTIRVRVV